MDDSLNIRFGARGLPSWGSGKLETINQEGNSNGIGSRILENGSAEEEMPLRRTQATFNFNGPNELPMYGRVLDTGSSLLQRDDADECLVHMGSLTVEVVEQWRLDNNKQQASVTFIRGFDDEGNLTVEFSLQSANLLKCLGAINVLRDGVKVVNYSILYGTLTAILPGSDPVLLYFGLERPSSIGKTAHWEPRFNLSHYSELVRSVIAIIVSIPVRAEYNTIRAGLFLGLLRVIGSACQCDDSLYREVIVLIKNSIGLHTTELISCFVALDSYINRYRNVYGKIKSNVIEQMGSGMELLMYALIDLEVSELGVPQNFEGMLVSIAAFAECMVNWNGGVKHQRLEDVYEYIPQLVSCLTDRMRSYFDKKSDQKAFIQLLKNILEASEFPERKFIALLLLKNEFLNSIQWDVIDAAQRSVQEWNALCGEASKTYIRTMKDVDKKKRFPFGRIVKSLKK